MVPKQNPGKENNLQDNNLGKRKNQLKLPNAKSKYFKHLNSTPELMMT